MDDAKHTPGPWAYDEATGRLYHADGDVEPTIAVVDLDNASPEQAGADGRLIAAAPQLQSDNARLREALDRLVRATTDGYEHRSEAEEGAAWEQADAVLSMDGVSIGVPPEPGHATAETPADPEPVDIDRLLAERRQIAVVWDVEDLQGVRPDLTDDQAWEVLQQAKQEHDGDIGINLSVLEQHAEMLFGFGPDGDDADESMEEAEAERLEETTDLTPPPLPSPGVDAGPDAFAAVWERSIGQLGIPEEEIASVIGQIFPDLRPDDQAASLQARGPNTPLPSLWPGATEQERIDAWESFRDVDSSGLTRAERDLYYHESSGGVATGYRLWTPDGERTEFPAAYSPAMTFRAADSKNAADMAKETYFDLEAGAVLTDESGNAFRFDGDAFREFKPRWEDFRDGFGVGSPAELKELFRERTEDYAARRAEDDSRLGLPASMSVPSVAELLADPTTFLPEEQADGLGHDNDNGRKR